MLEQFRYRPLGLPYILVCVLSNKAVLGGVPSKKAAEKPHQLFSLALKVRPNEAACHWTEKQSYAAEALAFCDTEDAMHVQIDLLLGYFYHNTLIHLHFALQ